MTRLLIADDHPLVRDALVSLLDGADDIEVVGGPDRRAAASMALETSPEVVLMDLEMPELEARGDPRTQGGRVERPRGHLDHVLGPQPYPRGA